MTTHSYRDTLEPPRTAAVPLDAVPRRLQRQPVQDRRLDAGRPRGDRGDAPAASCRSSAPSSSCRSCCSPATPGQLADVYSKRTVLVVTKSLEIVAAALGLFAFLSGHLELTYAVLFLIALQATFFSPGEIRHPARDAARPRSVARERRARDEHVRRHRRSARRSAASVRRAGTTVSGSSAWLVVARRRRSAPRSSFRIPARRRRPRPGARIVAESVGRDRARHRSGCAADRVLWLTVLGISYFWFLGSLLQFV